jgi:tryptophan synthase alpha chain
MIEQQHGIAALDALFARLKQEGRSAFMPYFPIGFPNYETSVAAIEAMAAAGVDGFEIGIPFSDPLADGPLVQAATQQSLENGVTVRKCLQAVSELRAKGIQQPMMMMGYVNPLMRYGIEQFVQDAKQAGADGIIVPDLPPEEASLFSDACKREGLALVFLLAPTSNSERIALVTQHATGFIYVVSLVGVTGVRTDLPADLKEFIARVRALSGDTPLVLGFGISTPQHVQMISELVDGFIVGSAMVKAGTDGVTAIKALTEQLRDAQST